MTCYETCSRRIDFKDVLGRKEEAGLDAGRHGGASGNIELAGRRTEPPSACVNLVYWLRAHSNDVYCSMQGSLEAKDTQQPQPTASTSFEAIFHKPYFHKLINCHLGD